MCVGGCDKVEEVTHLFFYCPSFGVVWIHLLIWLGMSMILQNDVFDQTSQFCNLLSQNKKVKNYFREFGQLLRRRFERSATTQISLQEWLVLGVQWIILKFYLGGGLEQRLRILLFLFDGQILWNVYLFPHFIVYNFFWIIYLVIFVFSLHILYQICHVIFSLFLSQEVKEVYGCTRQFIFPILPMVGSLQPFKFILFRLIFQLHNIYIVNHLSQFRQ